jgi:hypothetical protein
MQADGTFAALLPSGIMKRRDESQSIILPVSLKAHNRKEIHMKKRDLLIRIPVLTVTLGALLVSFETAQRAVVLGQRHETGPGLVSVAQAQEPGTELTVYNQNIALVRDTRPFGLEQGVNEVRFSDVASQIDPTSVHFRSLTDPEGTAVLEQNYEYDIVGTQKLMQKYVDQEIELVPVSGYSSVCGRRRHSTRCEWRRDRGPSRPGSAI